MSRSFNPGERSASTPSDEEDVLINSIHRSRKRHLPEGLLRGDLAADRLRQQEATASPLLKKQKPAEMALTLDEFRAAMRDMKDDNRKRFDSIDEGVAEVKGTVNKLSKTVKHNTTKIDAHEAQILATQQGLKELRDEIKLVRSAPLITNPTDSATTAAAEDPRYWTARKSLRLWPVRGTSRAELWASTGAFIGNILGFGNSVPEAKIAAVDRVEIPSGPGVREEVTVCFKEVETRDSVIGASAKLASHIDPSGKPTAGIRIEVPQNLRGQFRVLRNYAAQLRSRHGPGTRTHVKFDDFERSLFLNAKLPGEDRWNRVDVELARRGLTAKESRATRELEEKLDINGTPVGRPEGRPRARSTATPAAQPQAHTAVWTGRSRAESMDI